MHILAPIVQNKKSHSQILCFVKNHLLWKSDTPLIFITILQTLQIKLNCPSQLIFSSNAHNHLLDYSWIWSFPSWNNSFEPTLHLLQFCYTGKNQPRYHNGILMLFVNVLLSVFPWKLLPFTWLLTLNTDVFLPGISVTSTFCSDLFCIWDLSSPTHDYHISQ